MLPRLLGPFALLACASLGLAQKPIEITFLHTNDLHAHVEPTVIRGKSYGGYARIATLVKGIRAKERNVVLLNAGDTFQGTLYFNVYEGLADAPLLNMTGYAAGTLGNHEFDRGTGPTTAYAGAVNFPLVAANLKLAPEQSAFAAKIKPSIVLMVDGQKVGVIGVVTPDTPNISSPGAGVEFLDPYVSAQAEADRLTKAGVNKIVLLSHLGYDEDKRLAPRLKNIDLIIGGHSHTPLGTPDLPGWRTSGGAYPTLIKDADGRNLPIVQAWEWGKVLGRIRLAFDAKGVLTKVVAAEPLPVGEEITPDPQVQALVEAFAKPIAAVAAQPIGTASVDITDRNLLGQHIADSLLEGGKASGAVVAFMNSGGVRAGLEKGTITYGSASTVLPFRNTLVLLDLTGAEIETALGQLRMIPSAGTSYRMAGGKPTEIVIAGEPLDRAKTYRVATLNFLAGGGDSVFAFRDAPGRRLDTGKLDIDLWIDYLKAHSPLARPAEGRAQSGRATFLGRIDARPGPAAVALPQIPEPRRRTRRASADRPARASDRPTRSPPGCGSSLRLRARSRGASPRSGSTRSAAPALAFRSACRSRLPAAPCSTSAPHPGVPGRGRFQTAARPESAGTPSVGTAPGCGRSAARPPTRSRTEPGARARSKEGRRASKELLASAGRERREGG